VTDLLLASIPSPSQGVWFIGPVPVRAYALCIILGVVVACWLTSRRWVARGGVSTEVFDLAVWAVPFGIIGARLYHVITDYQLFFGPGRSWVDMFKIWQGGLGIWGAVALGALGAWIGSRRMGIRLGAFADAAAPGIVLAQAIGRWGNYFNQELFGRPTTLPWGLEIDIAHRPDGYLSSLTFHPTFLYECLWCVGVALVVIWADKRFTLGYGQAFYVYVIGYTIGRGWIEHLRIDPAHHIAGFRLNDWVSLGVCLLFVALLVVSRRRHPGREPSVYLPGREPATVAVAATEAAADHEADGPGADDQAADHQPIAADEPTAAGEPEPIGSGEQPAGDEQARPTPRE
jgi:phosphatidylglycerol---prolipoprotein diacylglyceryl transferase